QLMGQRKIPCDRRVEMNDKDRRQRYRAHKIQIEQTLLFDMKPPPFTGARVCALPAAPAVLPPQRELPTQPDTPKAAPHAPPHAPPSQKQHCKSHSSVPAGAAASSSPRFADPGPRRGAPPHGPAPIRQPALSAGSGLPGLFLLRPAPDIPPATVPHTLCRPAARMARPGTAAPGGDFFQTARRRQPGVCPLPQRSVPDTTPPPPHTAAAQNAAGAGPFPPDPARRFPPPAPECSARADCRPDRPAGSPAKAKPAALPQ